MKYRLRLSEKKLPGFEAVNFSIFPEQRAIHDKHVANGNVISTQTWTDPDNSNIIHKEIIYKSKEIADSIFAEVQSLGLLLSRPEGIEVFNVTGEEIPDQ